MTQLKLEVGKRYELGGRNDLYTYIGYDDDIYIFRNDDGIPAQFHKSYLDKFGFKEHIEEPMNIIENDLTACCNAYWNVGNICSNCKKIVSSKEEVKLEVGKKYNLKYNTENNPHKLIYIKNDDEDNSRLGIYVFIDQQGDSCSRTSLEIKGITEHRELKTRRGFFWVIYIPNKEADFDCMTDYMTNLFTNGGIYGEKEAHAYLDEDYSAVAKFEFTAKEFHDDQD